MRRKNFRCRKTRQFFDDRNEYVLTEKFQSKYESVYNKGAVTAFMLDLFIRNKTNNQKTLKSVIQNLLPGTVLRSPLKMMSYLASLSNLPTRP
jgi:hypothetical protein